MGIGYRDSKRERIFALYDWRCVYCRRNLKALRKRNRHIEHAIPVCKGGAKYDEENLRAACYRCNADKGTQTETEYLETLALRKGVTDEAPSFDFGDDCQPDTVRGTLPNAGRHGTKRRGRGHGTGHGARSGHGMRSAMRRNGAVHAQTGLVLHDSGRLLRSEG